MKKEEKSKATRKRIMDCAIKEFGTNGYDGATLNHICDAGISKGLIYHNYASKDAIFLAVVKQCFDELTSYLISNVVENDLQSYMDTRLAFFKNYPYYATIFFGIILRTPTHLKDQIASIREEFDDFNRKFYTAIIDSIELRKTISKDDALSYLRLIQTMFNGYFSSIDSKYNDYSSVIFHHEKELSKMLDFFLYGIAERNKNA